MILEAGPMLLLLAIVLMSGTIFSLLVMIAQWEDWSLGLLMAFFPLTIHLRRQDRALIDLLPIRIPVLYFLEYLLASLPLIGLLIYHQHLSSLLVFFIALVLIPFIPKIKYNVPTIKSPLLAFIPLRLFEFRIGFREQGVVIVFLFLLSLLTPLWIGVMPLFVFLMVFTATNFFDDFEPKESLERFHKAPHFLWQKLIVNLVFLQAFFSLSYVLFLLFHTQFWYFIPIAMVYSSCWLAFAILYKYAQYNPFRSKTASRTIVGIFGLLAFVPFFAPLILIALVVYFYKAKKQLLFNALNYA